MNKEEEQELKDRAGLQSNPKMTHEEAIDFANSINEISESNAFSVSEPISGEAEEFEEYKPSGIIDTLDHFFYSDCDNCKASRVYIALTTIVILCMSSSLAIAVILKLNEAIELMR